jgi:hypothetical protein
MPPKWYARDYPIQSPKMNYLGGQYKIVTDGNYHNTHIYLDGKELSYVESVQIDIEPNKPVKISIVAYDFPNKEKEIKRKGKLIGEPLH